MSNVPKEAIEVIAQSIGITNLSPDVAMLWLLMLNIVFEKSCSGWAKDLFYIDDKDVEFKEVLESPLSKAPIDTSVTSHWLAIEGIQPAIPENASVEGLSCLVNMCVAKEPLDSAPCFLDPTKTFPQHYGAIQGLAALGPSVVRLLILPNLEAYLHLLEPEMALEKQKNEIKRHEACCFMGLYWQVYCPIDTPDYDIPASGLCMYDRLKMFPSLLAPPTRPVWKNQWQSCNDNKHGQLDAATTCKENSNRECNGNDANKFHASDLQGAASSFSNSVGGSNIGVSSMSRPLSNDTCWEGRLAGEFQRHRPF
ncbi:Transcription initiation factor TFIID subunit 6b [Hibiscus syriacus]|uniref:Transcription initiation factor TFIID subunit 6b n=1 Tax=Hibiscus syriacus TaxID=106335 RepID=A0A6A3C577_HIBSY|nr:Transcription initiation factor TFIID subunit 6b [Hibiscus syriacus]